MSVVLQLRQYHGAELECAGHACLEYISDFHETILFQGCLIDG